jgi:alpha-beta hydrolase superfamily lysophospholipase
VKSAETKSEVGGCVPLFTIDELPGFEKATFRLPPEGDGELVATLVRTVNESDDHRPAVLYVHGFVDYFFQVHLARAFEEAGFRFYALDFRRAGRSLREGNREFFAREAEDYFAELDWAFNVIVASHRRVSALVAHSTGGLVAALYLAARRGREPAERLILNSPFLRFNLRPIDRALSVLVAKMGRLAPDWVVPQRMPAFYGRSIHKNYDGQWDYDLEKKPLLGFPLRAGWFRMIRKAHAQVAHGLDIQVPILSAHSDKSRRGWEEPLEANKQADIVLDVNDIKTLSPRLGKSVTLFEVPDGVHDLTLSGAVARNLALEKMVAFAQGK